jgi:hypothetical protein
LMALLLALLMLLACTLPSTARILGARFETIYEHSEIVCVADGIDTTPPAPPTADVPETFSTYRYRVVHVWKGEPPDTLSLHSLGGLVFAPDGRAWMSFTGDGEMLRSNPGERYMIFAGPVGRLGLLRAGWGSRPLVDAQAYILQLQRTVGPGRRVSFRSAPVPVVSYRSLIRDLHQEEERAQDGALKALWMLPDSAGVALTAISVLIRMPVTVSRRPRLLEWVCSRADTSAAAMEAFSTMLESADARMRLDAARARINPVAVKVQRRILARRLDPDPEIRAAVLDQCAGLLAGESPPVTDYLEALGDSVAEVRIRSLAALEKCALEPEVETAIRERTKDADLKVAALARKILERMATSIPDPPCSPSRPR